MKTGFQLVFDTDTEILIYFKQKEIEKCLSFYVYQQRACC